MTEPKLHPACAAWLTMPEAGLAELAKDLARHGQREPIVMLGEDILDGRNRWLACQRAGMVPLTRAFGSLPTDGEDPITFVISKNKHRRHSTSSQIAISLARLANLRHGSNRYQNKVDLVSDKVYSGPELAKLGGVAISSIDNARAVLKGAPHIVKMVEDGVVAVRVASEVVRHTPRAAQADLTAAEVKRIGRAALRSYPSAQKRASRSPAAPPVLRRPMPQYRHLSGEEAGMPPADKLGEQHPDYPAGVNRAMAHTIEHGHIQLWPPAETARLKLRARFTELNGLIMQLSTVNWPQADEIERLDPKDSERVRRVWNKHLGAAHARLTAYLAVLEDAAGEPIR